MMSTPSELETLEGLKRKLVITIENDKISSKLDSRLKELVSQVRLKGFRPGKVPFNEVKRRFGNGIRLEIIEQLIGESFQQEVKAKDLKLAGRPEITPINLEEGDTVSFAATFEVLPEFELAPLTGAKLEKYKVTITDENLDTMIDKMRKQHSTWNDVDRAAKEGDKVIIDFEGTIEGKPLEGGSAQGHELELGLGNMIEGFESGIVGAKVGSELELNLSFPKDYHHKDIAGKPVDFKIKVHKVLESQLPELNDEFADKLKVEGGIDKLRDEVRANLEREAEKRSMQLYKDKLYDLLLEKNNFELPSAMVEYELQEAKKRFAEQAGVSQEQIDSLNMPEAFVEDAKKRVALGLIFSKISASDDLEVTQELIDAKLDELAAPFSNPESIKQLYKSNPNMLDNINGQIMEDLTVAKLTEQVTLNEKAIDFDELDKVLQQGAK